MKTMQFAVVIWLLLPAIGCRDSVEDSKVIGNEVVFALEKYKAAEGRYPDSLDELVPLYLDQIPLPTYGERKWEYGTRNDGAAFELTFRDEHYELNTGWDSDRRYWRTFDF